MTATETIAASQWESMRTVDTRMLEDALRGAGFETVDAYRYNSAVIRHRVIDSKFEGMRMGSRFDMIEPHLDRLPEVIQLDIIMLLAIAPSELAGKPRKFHQYSRNLEFEQSTL